MTETIGLYGKMALIMGELERVAKDGNAKGLGYAFATDSTVSDLIRAKLSANRIAFFPSIVDVEQSEIHSARGTAGYHTVLTLQYTFVCADTGEAHTALWRGESDSYDDKGISKAATLAQKYFFLKTFVLSTGDPDDDPDSKNEEASQRSRPPAPRGDERRIPPPQQKGAPAEPLARPAEGDLEVEAINLAKRTFPFANGHKTMLWTEYVTQFEKWNVSFYATLTKELGMNQADAHAAANIEHIADWAAGTTADLWLIMCRYHVAQKYAPAGGAVDL